MTTDYQPPHFDNPESGHERFDNLVGSEHSKRAVLRATFPNRRLRCAILWTEKPVLMEISAEALARAALG